jgi:8-oxo-dGTP pyrophosphatase MutT (NUDIX family)
MTDTTAQPPIYHVDFSAHQKHPNLTPRDAATLIVMDRASSPGKVLLGRRNANQVFMPGKLVFPGGRLDAADHRAKIASPLAADIERRLLLRSGRSGPAKARGLAVAAVREAYEETGICLGPFADGAARDHDPERKFAQSGLLPDLANLHFIARAITPPRLVRRFDTRFFAADASMITHRIEGVVGPDTELVELVWLPIAEALTQDLLPIVRQVLLDLGERIAAGMPREAPVPYYSFARGHMRRQWL